MKNHWKMSQPHDFCILHEYSQKKILKQRFSSITKEEIKLLFCHHNFEKISYLICFRPVIIFLKHKRNFPLFGLCRVFLNWLLFVLNIFVINGWDYSDFLFRYFMQCSFHINRDCVWQKNDLLCKVAFALR